MQKIQVDMFEVQLGASMLLQFQLRDGQVVRVLADAGVDHASGYPIEHVFNKLFDKNGVPSNVWSDFSLDKPKLDLIVGTHYDADHLLGLIPIIENVYLEIDEIWLPPVQDDRGGVSIGSVSGGHTSLVRRLMEENSDEVLSRYFSERLARINAVDKIYNMMLSVDGLSKNSLLMRQVEGNYEFFRSLAETPDSFQNIEKALQYFETQHAIACKMLNQESYVHAEESQEDQDQRLVDTVDRLKYENNGSAGRFNLYTFSGHGNRSLSLSWRDDDILQSDLLALANIRKSAATEAINAANLARVVNAIKKRHVNGGSRIRVVSEAIPQGRPRYFRWNGTKFQESNPQARSELGFHLMGPSHELIAKLHDKLPIGTYLLAYRTERLMSGTVTPSNRLSYVMRFHLEDQAILVTGDAGFTDFAPARSKKYFPELLALLQPLHVVQVAHHGGMNHRFYEALRAGGLPGQTDWTFLMLSHGTNDATRPRAEFSRFVSLFRHGQRNDVSVLFTSQPTRDKVDTILDLIHPAVSSRHSVPTDRGDVRLSFPHASDENRAGTQWQVQCHHVQVSGKTST